MLKRVHGAPGDGLCHQLKAALVLGDTQLLCISGHSGTRCGRGKGALSYWESTFLGCFFVTVLIAATGHDVSSIGE